MTKKNAVETNTAAAATPAATELLTDSQAAAFLAVQSRTLRLWRHTRQLPHIRISSRVLRYRKTDLDGWLERRRVTISA
ncbi:MAG: helix-turn-helix domain-containing protein [Verrucomicrobiota bacterium]